jgi:hypothetical protein
MFPIFQVVASCLILCSANATKFWAVRKKVNILSGVPTYSLSQTSNRNHNNRSIE